MKKTVILLLALGLATQLFAEQKHDGVVALPHLMKLVLTNAQALEISEKQHVALDALLATTPQTMHAMMDEAAALEQQIKRGVLKEQKSFEALKGDLERLAKMEYAITQEQINALNKMQRILTKAQYKQVLQKLMQKKAQQ
jgi:hypothetical protein